MSDITELARERWRDRANGKHPPGWPLAVNVVTKKAPASSQGAERDRGRVVPLKRSKGG